MTARRRGPGDKLTEPGRARHIPVLLSEVLANLEPRDGKTYIDATLGAGGYTRAILKSADVHSTAAVLRALGVEIPALGDDITINGVGLRGLRDAAGELDCGNSGTSTRLLAGVVAGSGVTGRFVGDASLSRRPMRRIARSS